MSKRAENVFGSKDIFFGILVPYFEKNKNRLCTVFLGSACEQWINGECFYALVNSNNSFWVRPEKSKANLVLFKSPKEEEQNKASLVIETKILYSDEYPSDQKLKLDILRNQLIKASKRFSTDNVVGLLVFFKWEYRVVGETTWVPSRKTNKPFMSFFDIEKTGLKDKFAHEGRRHLGKEVINLRKYEYWVDAAMEVVCVK